jgi:hypothetical protein
MGVTPTPWIYEGDGVMRAASPYFVRRAEQEYTRGARYMLIEHQERSASAHNHYFASLTEAWMNLPEDIAGEFPTFEKFRATGLIATGFYDERRIICPSAEEAERMAAFIAPLNELAVVSHCGPAVVVRTPKSQSYRAMNKAEFRKSKEAVLAWAWGLVGVDPETGNREAGRAA